MKANVLTAVFVLSILLVTATEVYGCPPSAVLVVEPNCVWPGKTVTLDGSDSTDTPPGYITKYEWDFTNNGSYDYNETSSHYPDGAFDGKTTHVYESNGIYTAKLRVTDNASLTDTDTCVIDVNSEDLDNDGLPGAWEQQYGLSDSYFPDADQDLDSDGYNNLCEYLHESDPNDDTKVPDPNFPITIYVPSDVNSIQRSINASVDGDTIVVSPGTYYELIYFDGKAITVTGTDPNDWTVIAITTNDANDPNEYVITFENSEDTNSILKGFVITGGDLGIYCNNASPTISNCVITGNGSGIYDGAGLYDCNGSSPTVTNCFFIENDANYGGGIYNIDSSPTIANCVFSKNLASVDGGGIYNFNSSPTLTNCTFSGNFADGNGGAMCNDYNSTPVVINCIFWSNDANGSGDEAYNAGSSDPNFSYCDIQGCGGSGGGWDPNFGTDSGGNCDGDPNFIDANDPAGPDSILGTYDDGLRFLTDSICVDAADGNAAPSTDITGYQRNDFAYVDNAGTGDPNYSDMGAYESRIILFADKDATGGDDGTSWDDAFDDLQDALANANAGEEIWVADGTYNPTDGNSRSISFELVEGVGLYGGFVGTETRRQQRDWTTNETVLSGNIGTPSQENDNSYHVVKGADDAVLDGFNITGGNADGSGSEEDGGGMYNYSVSPTVANCTFYQNKAQCYGGGIYNGNGSSVTVIDCDFNGNTAHNKGGGMCNIGGSSITVIGCVFSNNTADYYGGGMFNRVPSTVTNCFFTENDADWGAGIYNTDSSPTLTNCVFFENETDEDGGGMYNKEASPLIVNCTFVENEADGGDGGGMYNEESDPVVTNCIFWDNDAYDGDEIYNDSSDPNLSYCNIKDCGGSGGGWDPNFGTDGGGNVDGDPCFMNENNPAGADGILGTIDDGLCIKPEGSCIDAADGNAAPSTDILACARLDVNDVNNTGTGDPNYADIGAYEFDEDADKDGMPYDWEVLYGLDPTDPSDADLDPDEDKLKNLEEYREGTVPTDADSDDDNMPDGWEVHNDLKPLDANDASEDPDDDDLINLEEYNNNTDPHDEDTDDDDMPDGWEVYNDLKPLDANDANEDPDNDGLVNLGEYTNQTNPHDWDSENDYMADGWEVDNGLDPHLDDSAGNPDGDDYTNVREYLHGSDPNDPNSIPESNTTITVPTESGSLQSAIDWSIDGDTVEALPGSYVESVELKGRAITVRGSDPNDWSVVEATIIDANGASSTVRFVSGEDSNSVLKGFTIKNGDSNGIYCSSSGATITNCVIEDNNSYSICVDSAEPAVEVVIMNNIIRGRVSLSSTGSISPIVKNNFISADVAEWPAALYISGNASGGIVRNNTIVHSSDSGIEVAEGSQQPEVSNCIVWGTDGTTYSLLGCEATYCCLGSFEPGTGNIDSDPRLFDPVSGDFHLCPDSPCINAGDPCETYADETDIDSQSRVWDVIEMGASENGPVYNMTKGRDYEFIQEAIDNATTHDEIVVDQGVYYESIDFRGKNITVRSTDPNNWDVVEATIIDANDSNAPAVALWGRSLSVLGTGLVGLWTLNEDANNTTVTDSSDEGNHGTASVYTSALHTTGKVDGAFGLLWDDEHYIQIPNSNSISVGTNDYTISAWIYSTSRYYTQAIVSKAKSDDDKEYSFFLSGAEGTGRSGLRLEVEKDGNNGYAKTAPGIVGDGWWQHVAVTFESSDKNVTFYYNGKAQTTVANTIVDLPDELNDDLYIGDWGGSCSGKNVARLDIVAIHDRALSADEIEILYNGGAGTEDVIRKPVLSGFTVTGGECGASSSDLASPIISSCIIKDNDSHGIYCTSSWPTIKNNKIIANSGDGIHVDDMNSAPTIKNNVIYDNAGGTTFDDANSLSVVRNNTIADNDSYGIYVGSVADPNITNCILWNNDDDLYGCSATYSCIEDGDPGPGNISDDPLFVDPNSCDYRLDTNSPCIDVGDPNGDYEGESDINHQPRVQGPCIDMGADEADPIIWVEPNSLTITLFEGETGSKSFTLGNNGGTELYFDIWPDSIEAVSKLGGEKAGGQSASGQSGSSQDELVLEYSFDEPIVVDSNEYDHLIIEGLDEYEEVGAPIVPKRTVRALVPFGKEVVGTTVEILESRDLPGVYYLPPGQQQYPVSYKGEIKATEPDPAIYGLDKPWPGVYYANSMVQSKRGYQLYLADLYPLQYYPRSGRVSYISKLRLRLNLADKTKRSVLRPTSELQSYLLNMVDNPEMLATYPSRSEIESMMEAQGGGIGRGILEGGPYKYIIITNQELLNTTPEPWTFERLRDSKIVRGIPATIVTTEWIYANYDANEYDPNNYDSNDPNSPSNLATEIRMFLMDSFYEWGTEYVLLGGASTIIPVRKLYGLMYPDTPEHIPCDMYYGCVDPNEDTFNYDQDEWYGECHDGVDGGEVDLLAEIYVGRAAVENGDEVTNFVRKTLTYGTTITPYHLPRITMVGQIGSSSKERLEQIRLGGTYDEYFTWGFENHETPDFYDFNTAVNLYDCDYDWSKSDLMDVMDNGVHVINHLGHGSRVSWLGTMGMSTSDMDSLTNSDYFFVYSQACIVGAFDVDDCFAEEFVAKEHGAFAAIMNSRVGLGLGPSHQFNRRFWHTVLDPNLSNRVLEVGRANQLSKERYFIPPLCTGPARWLCFTLNVFGDPEQQFLFGQERETAWAATKPSSGTLGDHNSMVIDVNFSAEILPGGTYNAEIIITSNDPIKPKVTIPIAMTVLQKPPAVTPYGSFVTERIGEKDSFTPGCMVYTLTNNGNTSLNWTASNWEDWLDIEPNSGSLDPNKAVDVNVCVNANAYSLSTGSYYDVVTFTNTSTGDTHDRVVWLHNRGEYFTEVFDDINDVNDFDIENQVLTFSPDGSEEFYRACRQIATDFPTDPEGGTSLSPYWYESYTWERIDLDQNEVSLYGVDYNYVYVGGHGMLTFEPDPFKRLILVLPNMTLTKHFMSPSISGLFSCLAPWDGGTISYKKLSDQLAITFENVPDIYNPDGLNNFQVELFFDGRIRITHLNLDLYGTSEGFPFFVGLSEGNGIPDDFAESDLSDYGSSCPRVHNITKNLWYLDIQPSLDEANNNDVIEVYPDTYFESIDFGGKAVIVKSTDPNDWEVVENTIIDANGELQAVYFHNSEDANSILTGLTVRNGVYGVLCYEGAWPEISKCIIEDNIAYGVFCAFNCPATITNNKIEDQTNSYSVGIYAYQSAPTIKNNFIYENQTGICFAMAASSAPIVRNNTVVDNLYCGIAVEFTSGPDPNISNCIIWNNNNELYNCTLTYSCIKDCNDVGDPNTTQNICDDPCFVNYFEFSDTTTAAGTTTTIEVADANKYDVNDVIEYSNDGVARTVTDVNTTTDIITFANDPLDSNSAAETRIYNWGPEANDLNEDFHIYPDSPCIDAGDPNGTYTGESDIDFEDRVMGDYVEMGADEYDPNS